MTENPTTANITSVSEPSVPWWQSVLLCGLAGGMGWGIRGQYGHESGAMMAGLLVSSVVAMLFLRGADGWGTVRAIAWCTVAIGFGGSETYGQTIGLTQNPYLIGNFSALSWGLIGLAIKGSLWIGFAGCFLGMGLSGVTYSRREMLAIVVAMPLLYAIGVRLINSPFDPANQQLPAIYFSETWDWKPDGEVKPRFEAWGGLFLAMIGLLIHCGVVRRDRLAARLGLAGLIGGGLGFPAGQCLQANHAWNRPWYETGFLKSLDPHVNWWNMMEITFGGIMGATLGFFVWKNRHLIRIPLPTVPAQAKIVDGFLFLIHVTLLLLSEFAGVAWVDALYGVGFCMGAIPLVACVQSQRWPFLLTMPILVLPIAGKTVRELVYKESAISAFPGWLLYFVLPMCGTCLFSLYLIRLCEKGADGRALGARLLMFGAWCFFLLNYAFFRFPWPWQEWTGRTPSGIIYLICIGSLTIAAIRVSRRAPE
ncbi:MAG: hypothetical protein U0936_26285 [Planctomycetaceae bacterium]